MSGRVNNTFLLLPLFCQIGYIIFLPLILTETCAFYVQNVNVSIGKMTLRQWSGTIARVVFSAFFRQIYQETCRNFELDEDFG